MLPDLTLIVNAGGQSRRMGQPKALLPTPGGVPLLVHVVQRLAPLAAAHTVIVANDGCEYIEAGEVADFQGCATAMRELFDRFTDVDAVISSDIGAACCVQEVFRRGMRVPQDVQVVAYDGTYLTDMAGLRLTAVCQDFDALAGTAVARMMDAIEGRPVDSAGDVIPVSLREADTTRR